MTNNNLTEETIERTIREYFQACNDADVETIASFFEEAAVHYFPPGMYGGPFVGGEIIGERWAEAVETLGSVWTVDEIMTDPDSARAVIEWTHFKTNEGEILRGDEWYEFNPESGLIREIRAYYAAPQSSELDRNELEGFDYESRDYPIEPPFTRW